MYRKPTQWFEHIPKIPAFILHSTVQLQKFLCSNSYFSDIEFLIKLCQVNCSCTQNRLSCQETKLDLSLNNGVRKHIEARYYMSQPYLPRGSGLAGIGRCYSYPAGSTTSCFT